MRQTVIIRYTETEEFNRKYEEWQKANPRARQVSQHHRKTEHPSIPNGIYDGVVEYEEV